MMSSILKLDAAGQPMGWIDVEKAAYYVAKNLVLWDLGDEKMVLRGGHNAHGVQSTLVLPTIMAIKGQMKYKKPIDEFDYSRECLLRRDCNMCAYCGKVFKSSLLEIEHVLPQSRGGATTFSNTVSACRGCNSRKGAQTPEEAGMPLLYVPYTPNLYEGLILRGRSIKADQMEYLLRGVPKNSRVRKSIEDGRWH